VRTRPLHAWLERLPGAGLLRLRLPRAVAIVVAALLIALLLPLALPAERADAASCGTNWPSRKTPPKSIRVFIANRNKVVVVPFRTYVPMVMASGEFPSWLPSSVLEAGATAVKQYGWYYALKGNHRPNYKTRQGVCYDVRSDTNDQLYKTVAHPTKKQQKAVDATWGLTLRKGGRFFLTGYRAGTASRCGADADGWRLYAKSMVDCAKKGWGRQRIQDRYYQPRVEYVWRHVPPPSPDDRNPPTLSVPEAAPVETEVFHDRVKTQLSWSATDDSSGVDGYTVQQRVDGAGWKTVALDSKRATSVQLILRPGHDYEFRVRAKDRAGNATDYVQSASFRPGFTQAEGVTLKGGWSRAKRASASGEETRYSTNKGAKAIFEFDGAAVGLVAPRGPGLGKARIRVDGVVAEVIDFGAGSLRDRRIVFRRSWPAKGHHTISVEVLATNGRPRVEVDAFVVLR
jgi:hypothetical protein